MLPVVSQFLIRSFIIVNLRAIHYQPPLFGLICLMIFLLAFGLFFGGGKDMTEEKTHDAVHWGYEGKIGPEHWGDISPDFCLCKEGKKQSPINIQNAQSEKLPPLNFVGYEKKAWKITNNGHTIQIDPDSGNTLVVGDKRFKLLQFHFHAPSENQLEGRTFSMEAHLVHRDDEGSLGVIGVFIDKGEKHPLIEDLWVKLPETTGENQASSDPIDILKLFPRNKGYFYFTGSLTTPPCSEEVSWYMMREPITLSEEQINAFTKLYKNNARAVQPLNGRIIRMSK